jgi:NADP-dependent 3-hydroxy acid dehydrogenase YdfG
MRTVIVAGASSGIGLAVAEEFARHGWAVTLGARRVDRLRDAVDAITSRGGLASASPLDVADPASVEEFFAASETAFGVADAVVCNAGVAVPGTVVGSDPADLRRMIEVNLLGALQTARRGLLAQLEAGGGRDIVFVTSDGVERPYPNLLTYGATKAAVEYAAEGMRLEVAGTGTRIITVRLGPVESEFGDGFDPAQAVALMRQWKRHGVHADVGMTKLPAADVASVLRQTVELPRSVDPRMVQLGPTPPVDDS